LLFKLLKLANGNSIEAIVKLPKFKENNGKEREFKFESIENSSSTTFEEYKVSNWI